MRAGLLLFCATVVVGLGIACTTRDGSDGGAMGTESPIVNGELDAVHEAVVTIVSRKGDEVGHCTGTIVKRDVPNDIAWVVTAAHCVDELPPVRVVSGEDFAHPAREYGVIDWTADPRYEHKAGSPYDFAVVRIDRGSTARSVIPLIDGADDLVAGSTVTSVGFGRTTVEADAGDGHENTKRRAVEKTASAVRDDLIVFDMSTSGFCEGDSGGPLLVGEGADERVVGVHSHFMGTCNGQGFSGRVTAAAAFFAEQLGRGRPQLDCASCSAAAARSVGCVQARSRCLGRKECRAYYECRASNAQPDACPEPSPVDALYYAEAASCPCEDECASLCTSTPAEAQTDGGAPPDVAPPPAIACRTLPRCGIEKSADTCGACIEAECCAEALACAADTSSARCFKTLGAPIFDREVSLVECNSDRTAQKLNACAASKCAAPCSGPSQSGASAERDSGASRAAPVAAPEPAHSQEAQPPAAAPKEELIRVPGAKSCSFSSRGGESGGSAFSLAIGALLAARARRRSRDARV